MSEHLRREIAALSAEIRHYPTPIARCDEQLADLLQRRGRLVELLGRADHGMLERADRGMLERADRGMLERADRGMLERADRGAGGCTPAATWVNDGGFDGA